jgi:uncharacterized lipoprotein YmbA
MKRFFFLVPFFLVSCTIGSSPEPTYYDLSAKDGTPLTAPDLFIEVHRPTLPSYLDRPQMVREENTYQYTVDDIDWWAEPLDTMFLRILTDDLRQRLPASRILSELDADTSFAPYSIETDIDQFNAIEGNRVAFKATLSINDKTGLRTMHRQPVEFSLAAAPTPEALASSLSELTAAYADLIVKELQEEKICTPAP